MNGFAVFFTGLGVNKKDKSKGIFLYLYIIQKIGNYIIFILRYAFSIPIFFKFIFWTFKCCGCE